MVKKSISKESYWFDSQLDQTPTELDTKKTNKSIEPAQNKLRLKNTKTKSGKR